MREIPNSKILRELQAAAGALRHGPRAQNRHTITKLTSYSTAPVRQVVPHTTAHVRQVVPHTTAHCWVMTSLNGGLRSPNHQTIIAHGTYAHDLLRVDEKGTQSTIHQGVIEDSKSKVEVKFIESHWLWLSVQSTRRGIPSSHK